MLVDPVWGFRVSPSPVFGPTRLHEPPMPLEALPQVDAILISHDHYDHLDLPTVRGLLTSQSAPFVVPLGDRRAPAQVGRPGRAHRGAGLERGTTVGGLTLTCTEARHFSGRYFYRDTTLWASWSVAGPRHRVFFGGDTGYTPAFAEIGARLGPFDLTLLPVGAYNDAWHAIHMDPEEAMRAHGDLGGRVFLPIHWATFNLAFHRWAEPAQRRGRGRRAGGGAGRRPRAGSADRRAGPAASSTTGGRRSGASTDHPEHRRDAGVGSAVLARTLSRLLALLPD